MNPSKRTNCDENKGHNKKNPAKFIFTRQTFFPVLGFFTQPLA